MCQAHQVLPSADASVFVVSAAGVSTSGRLESCRSLFSAGLRSATPGNSAGSTSSPDDTRYTIVLFSRLPAGWGAPSFALEYASFLGTSAMADARCLGLRRVCRWCFHTWLESCRSLFSAGLLSAIPGNSASSTSSLGARYTIVFFPRSLAGWGRRAPTFALKYASFLAALRAPPATQRRQRIDDLFRAKRSTVNA